LVTWSQQMVKESTEYLVSGGERDKTFSVSERLESGCDENH